MNWPETIEKALRDTFAEFAPEGVRLSWLHSSQDQIDERNATASQLFPQIHFRVSALRPESEGCTWAAGIEAVCATWFADDPGLRVRADLFEAVECFFTRLAGYRSFRAPRPEAVAFESRVRATRPGFHLGGFVIEGGNAPEVADSQVATHTFAADVHFSVDDPEQ